MKKNDDKMLKMLLTDDSFEEVMSKNSTIKQLEQVDEIIYLINLAEQVASKYSKELSNSFEVSIRGLRFGLSKYRDKVLARGDDIKLSAYLTWFMKTSIEFELGLENDDTFAWQRMLED